MNTGLRTPDAGFLRAGSIFVMMMLLGNILEVGFTALTAYLPGTGYETVNALFNIYFILIAPLAGIQFMTSKEVASYLALHDEGKVRAFVSRTLSYVMLATLWIVLVGVVMSRQIALFLHIGNAMPVIILMGVVLCYAPYPVFYGTIQGMKRFYTLGGLQFVSGSARFTAVVISLYVFAGTVGSLLGTLIFAMLLCSFIAFLPARRIFKFAREKISSQEITRAYSLVVPIVLTLLLTMILKNMDIILAKRFFDSADAQAYTCAARVGSAFFVLSGIIMVMYPHVSEEKTLGRDPIQFLFKSLGLALALSMIGFAFTIFAPELVMYIITLGKGIPGAPPLIRLIGFMVLPLTMTYIMVNYLLAKHYAGFLPILFGGVLLQVFLFTIMHQSPRQLLTGLGISNTVVFVLILFYVVFEHRQYVKVMNAGKEETATLR